MKTLKKNPPHKITRLVSQLVDQLIIEFKKPNNIDKIQVQVLNPLIQYTFSRLYPYILATSVIFFLIFILAILIFILIFKIYKTNSS